MSACQQEISSLIQHKSSKVYLHQDKCNLHAANWNCRLGAWTFTWRISQHWILHFGEYRRGPNRQLAITLADVDPGLGRHMVPQDHNEFI